MSGHVILCGLGHVGFRVAQLLGRLGEPVTVITLAAEEERLRAVREAGMRVMVGNARDERLLDEAGIATARAVIAATHSDITNVEIALDARRARPDIAIVARLFDQSLARSFEGAFEVRRALGMSVLAAPRFAAAALDEERLASFEIEGRAMAVQVVRGAVPAGATVIGRGAESTTVLVETALPLAGSTAGLRGEVAAASKATPPRRPSRRATPRLLLAVWRDAPRPLRVALVALLLFAALSTLLFHQLMRLDFVDALYFIVTTITTTGYGDITPRDQGALLKLYACALMLVGSCTMAIFFSFVTDYVVGERFRRVSGRREVPERDHVVVVGLGNLGYRIADALEASGVPTAAVELEGSSPFNSELASRAALVLGDARLPGILAQAGVARARAIVAATGDDAVNLSVGLAARQLNPRIRTVLRIFDPDLARKVEQGLHIDRALSASQIAAPHFVAAALFPGVQAAFVEDHALVALCTPDLTPRRLPLT